MANARFRPRGDTAANMTSVNPTLAVRELALELDTGKMKVGDGTTPWTSLAYFGGGGAVSSVQGRTGAVTLISSDVTGALGYTPMRGSNNLSEVTNAATARTNIGVTGGFTAIVADRTALSSLSTTHIGAYLKESGREGIFVWDGSNNSANVTADTAQGLYVAPASDTTGASGAWVRKFSGPADFRWFGAVADCTANGVGTDNTPFFDAARTALVAGGHGWLHIPQQPAAYRFATPPAEIHDKIELTGEGWSYNPGVVGGATYIGVQVYNGTVLSFAPDVPGLLFVGYTDNLANAAVHEFQSAVGSTVKNIMFYSEGGTGTTSHGIERRTSVHLDNVRIEGFAGYGLKTTAYSSGANPDGSVDCTNCRLVSCRFNKLSGFFTEGDDANANHFDTCDSALNGGVGYLDKSLLGNKYTVPHAATNNASFGTPAGYSAAQRTQNLSDWAGLSDQMAGSYVTTSTVAAHVFDAGYAETGIGQKHEIISPSVINGGNLASAPYTASASATIINGGGAFTAMSLAPIPGFGSTLTSTHSVFVLAPGSGSPIIKVNPGSGTFSGLQLLGSGGSSTLGLDVSAGLGSAAYSSDTQIFRNAAQNVTFGTFSSAGLNLGAASSLSFNGTTIINSSGVLQAAGFPALTGDVTTTAGSLATTLSSATVVGKLSGQTLTGKLTSFTSTTGSAGITVPHGVAPTSPVNGDLWTTTAGIFWRINGATVQVATGGGTATGTNTGDQTITLTGDATGSGTGIFAVTVGKINGVSLAGLATGILKNTTTTGVPSIAVAADFRTINQNTTGSAATLTTGRTIAMTGDVSWTSPAFDGSGNVTAAGTLATVNGNVGSFGSATAVPVVTVNGKGLVTAVSTTTITTPAPSVQSVTSAATVTPTFSDDMVKITAQAAGLTLANPSGTAVAGHKFIIRIKDNGTAQTIAYGTQYRAIGVTLPTTTVISKNLYLGCIWNADDTKLDVVAVSQE